MLLPAGGSWGEVAHAQGGVVVPYLDSYSLASGGISGGSHGSSPTSPSFGYADCLKWGYDGSIQMVAFSAAQAADVLGLDLARVRRGCLIMNIGCAILAPACSHAQWAYPFQDVETQLLATSIDGEVVGILGRFLPVQKTLAGCQCSQRWVFENVDTNRTETVLGGCINPRGDPRGAWCVYEPDSCTNATGECALFGSLAVCSLTLEATAF